MNQVVVEGIVSSDVVRTELPSGDVLMRWTVRTPGPDERQHALPVAWSVRPLAHLASSCKTRCW